MSSTQPNLTSPASWQSQAYDGFLHPLWKIPDLYQRGLLLRTFYDPLPTECEELSKVNQCQWNRLVRWLHTSGLALYLFERLSTVHQVDILPGSVQSALQRNLEDNALRTDALIEELGNLDRELNNDGIRYVVLKGFSLFPDVVPRPELRSQLDLDLLLEPDDIRVAGRILEGHGYRLRAVSKSTWEFQLPNESTRTLNDLYKARRFETIELHVARASNLLARAEQKQVRNLTFLVLPRPDVLLGQALHLFKHVCAGFVRTAHFLEFRNSIIAQVGDTSFWPHLQQREAGTTKSWLSFGMAIRLASQVLGPFAPAELTSWTADRLPEKLQLWSAIYGMQSVLCDFPGNKLYLLLQPELQRVGLAGLRSRSRTLLPLKLPGAIYVPMPAEDPATRLRRYKNQAAFALFRLRFHLVEGMHYLSESFRWRRHLRGTVQ